MEGGREGKGGREGGRKDRPGRRSGTLPTASRSLYQVPMEGRVAPALGLKDGQPEPARKVS